MKFFENFQNFSGIRGLTSLRGRPPKVFTPPNRNPGGAAALRHFISEYKNLKSNSEKVTALEKSLKRDQCGCQNFSKKTCQ